MKLNEALNLFCEEGKPPLRDENKKTIKDENGKTLRGGTGIAVFDIDDNLLKADSSNIKIWKKVNGKEIPLSTDEFAKDDGKNPDGSWKPGVTYDYREFRDAKKVKDSIEKAKPIMPTLKALDNYIQQGYDFCFLTARGMEKEVGDALNNFLRYRDKNGELKELGRVFKRDVSRAVNDSKYDKEFKGVLDPQRKALVLKDLCNKYDNVVFFDDDAANVSFARKLNLLNLKVVHTGKR